MDFFEFAATNARAQAETYRIEREAHNIYKVYERTSTESLKALNVAGDKKMDNRIITLEYELSGEVMEACAHLDATQVIGGTMNAPGISISVVGDSHPPENEGQKNEIQRRR